MRLWSLHPRYLDSKGLVALWREALLAQAVLQGKTKGYQHHPQLVRFHEQPSAVNFIAEYLRGVHAESESRGFNFDVGKIPALTTGARILLTQGQIDYEWQHLLRKLERRAPRERQALDRVGSPEPHPLFRLVEGGIAEWERT